MSITEGETPERTYLGSGVSEVDIHRRTPMDYGDRINPPPDSGPDWWWTGKRWRKSPPRAMSIDREGLHAVVGAVFGLMPFLAYWWGDSMLLAACLVAQALGVVSVPGLRDH